jgi:hypothetical protein
MRTLLFKEAAPILGPLGFGVNRDRCANKRFVSAPTLNSQRLTESVRTTRIDTRGLQGPVSG